MAHDALQSGRDAVVRAVHGAGALAAGACGGLGVEVGWLLGSLLGGVWMHSRGCGRGLLDHRHLLCCGTVGYGRGCCGGGLGGVGWWCALGVGAVHVAVHGLLLLGDYGRVRVAGAHVHAVCGLLGLDGLLGRVAAGPADVAGLAAWIRLRLVVAVGHLERVIGCLI